FKGSSRFVIIIDGLDHVWREQDSIEELSILLDSLLPIPENVTLLFGTQDVPDGQLPRKLLHYVPRNQWIEMPFLKQEAVLEWTKQNKDYICLPETVR